MGESFFWNAMHQTLEMACNQPVGNREGWGEGVPSWHLWCHTGTQAAADEPHRSKLLKSICFDVPSLILSITLGSKEWTTDVEIFLYYLVPFKSVFKSSFLFGISEDLYPKLYLKCSILLIRGAPTLSKSIYLYKTQVLFQPELYETLNKCLLNQWMGN